jgi:hypothetical protein
VTALVASAMATEPRFALLAGKLVDESGAPLAAMHASKGTGCAILTVSAARFSMARATPASECRLAIWRRRYARLWRRRSTIRWSDRSGRA